MSSDATKGCILFGKANAAGRPMHAQYSAALTDLLGHHGPKSFSFRPHSGCYITGMTTLDMFVSIVMSSITIYGKSVLPAASFYKSS